MSGLLDLAPITEEVVVGKVKIQVAGLTIEDIFYLVKAFPEIKAILERRVKEITAERMMEMAPRALATIIACSTGQRDDPKAVAVARRLSADNTLVLLQAVFRQTFPEGVGPFVRKLQGLQGSFGASGTPTTPQETPSDENEASAASSSTHISAALEMDEGSRKRFAPRPAH